MGMFGTCFSSEKVEPDNAENGEVASKGARSPGTKSTLSLVSEDFRGSTKSRSCTDVFFLLLMIAFTITLLGLIIYCIANGDINRIVNGYDSCGNVCGIDNEKDDEFQCRGKNLTMKPYLLISEPGDETNLHRQCVSECPNSDEYSILLNRCIQKQSEKVINKIFSKTGIVDFLEEVAEDLQVCWREILYMCLLALLFSAIILIMFRFAAGLVIWLVLACVAVASVAGTIYLWVRWSMLRAERKRNLANETEEDQSDIDKETVMAYLIFAIIATIVTFLILLVILIMRKRIQLVVQLFKEAGKAVASMPLLLVEPILTFVSLALVVALWMVFSICIESSGFLHKKENVENYEFRKDGAMKFTRWYNLFALFWFSQFVLACQQMVIAGAVSKWFFTRNKDNLGSPILKSFHTLVRFHLGTVALGSLLIALIQLVRSLIAAVEAYTRDSNNSFVQFIFKACHCCLYCFEKVLQYISRNAYIVTAIHGYSFCKSGQEAFKMLTSNALRVTAINSVGDFVLILGKLLVVIATVLCGFEMLRDNESIQHLWVPMVLAGLFALFVAHAFISVYEMTIDTIFLCFCQDCEQNDGISRPYFMSRGLMEFVENSKKALEVLENNEKDYSGTSTRSVK